MSVPLNIVQGEPLVVTATVTGGAATYAAGHEVRGQVRPRPGGKLLLDLDPSLTSEIVGDDVRVTLSLNGSQTRQVSENGVYDVFLSEPGDADNTALRVLHGPVKVELAVTR